MERAPATGPASEPGGTVRDLLDAAKDHAAVRRRAEAERRAQEHARQQREAAIARAKYLDGLAGREEELWRRVETLVEAKRATEYAQAAQYLQDLRDLAARADALGPFQARLATLRNQHTRKPGFLARMDRAGLTTTA